MRSSFINLRFERGQVVGFGKERRGLVRPLKLTAFPSSSRLAVEMRFM